MVRRSALDELSSSPANMLRRRAASSGVEVVDPNWWSAAVVVVWLVRAHFPLARRRPAVCKSSPQQAARRGRSPRLATVHPCTIPHSMQIRMDLPISRWYVLVRGRGVRGRVVRSQETAVQLLPRPPRLVATGTRPEELVLMPAAVGKRPCTDGQVATLIPRLHPLIEACGQGTAPRAGSWHGVTSLRVVPEHATHRRAHMQYCNDQGTQA